jgi:heme exporter protein D
MIPDRSARRQRDRRRFRSAGCEDVRVTSPLPESSVPGSIPRRARQSWLLFVIAIGLPVVLMAWPFFAISGHRELVWLAVVLAFAAIALAFTLMTLVARWLGPREDRLSAALRARGREQLAARGWTYSAEAAPLSRELEEAVMQAGSRRRAWTRASDVITGTWRGRAFTAEHVDAFQGTPGGSTPIGSSADDNIVVMPTPGLVPELRIRDTGIRAEQDYGLGLPPVAAAFPGLGPRWQVQTPYPQFAADLLTPELCAYLDTVPVPCTIAFRYGAIVSTGDLIGSVETIQARLEVLSGVLDRVPAAVWGRADDVTAGKGAYAVLGTSQRLTNWAPQRT